MPLIETVPPEDPTELDDALLALESGWFGWLVVTSAAAVPVLVDRAQESAGQPAAAAADGQVRVAAIGPGTARALRDVGVEPDLVPRGRSTSRGLVEAFPAPTEPGRVLFPRGDLAATTVVAGLGARLGRDRRRRLPDRAGRPPRRRSCAGAGGRHHPRGAAHVGQHGPRSWPPGWVRRRRPP